MMPPTTSITPNPLNSQYATVFQVRMKYQYHTSQVRFPVRVFDLNGSASRARSALA